MKAISLWQPWASAMPLGLKGIETRHWDTDVRGRVAIHAAKHWTREERDFGRAAAARWGKPVLADPPLGAIIAVGELVITARVEEIRGLLTDRELAWGNYADGRFGWRFESVVGLREPIPFTGRQGWFTVPDDLVLGAL